MFLSQAGNPSRIWHNLFQFLILRAVQLCTPFFLTFEPLYVGVTSKSCVDEARFLTYWILNLMPFVIYNSCVSLLMRFPIYLYCSPVLLCSRFNVIFNNAIKVRGLACHKTRFNPPFFFFKNVLYQVRKMAIVIS